MKISVTHIVEAAKQVHKNLRDPSRRPGSHPGIAHILPLSEPGPVRAFTGEPINPQDMVKTVELRYDAEYEQLVLIIPEPDNDKA